MRKMIVHEFISLDGVIQAPGGAEEDTDYGFAYGGRHRHDVARAKDLANPWRRV